MADQYIFPAKYHVVWLDQHIGDPKFCVQLKRAFFTNIAANSEHVVSVNEKDLDYMMALESEMALTFENFHFTLQAFREADSCLRYIDSVKDDRVLVIASNHLGQSAVPTILERYPNTFTNPITREPHSSVYIFCQKMLKAVSWAVDWVEYVQIFTSELDLLARITRDLGDEFLDQGENLLKVEKLELAVERLSWAKSLHIRHEKYTNCAELKVASASSISSVSSSRQSATIIKIDSLIEQAELRLKEVEQVADNHDALSTMASFRSTGMIRDHQIIWLDEQIDSCVTGLTVSNLDGSRADIASGDEGNLSSRHYLNLLQAGLLSYFPDSIEDIRTFDKINECQTWVDNTARDQMIFLVVSSAYAYQILPNLEENWSSIRNIYIFGHYEIRIIDRIPEHQQRGVKITFGDCFNDLLTQLMDDLSIDYSLKAKGQHILSTPGVTPAVSYPNQSKFTEAKTYDLQSKSHETRIDRIEKETIQRSTTRMNSLGHNLNQRIQLYNEDENQESTVLLCFVGYETIPIDVESDIGYSISCVTMHQWKSALPMLKRTTSVIIISSELNIDDISMDNHLIHYYYFTLKSDEIKILNKLPHYISPISSIARLTNELYNKLGQFYRKRAMELSKNSSNRGAAKLILQKSTKCYELLKSEAEKAMKNYAALLKKSDTKTT